MQPAGTDSVHLKVCVISRGPFQSLGFFDLFLGEGAGGWGGSPGCLNFGVVVCPLDCLVLCGS